MSSSAASLSYHEPGVVTILVLASFLLLENAINYLFDYLLYCGLIGQIAIGVAWGTPGANWLSEDVQNTVMQLGYIGLILLVYEGGLQTNTKTLKSNLFLSSLVALIGISAPIGLSFTLQGFVETVTPVQGFAAGAALCSTSLGTTFTILSTSGLIQSRLGVVLSTAAMMDDIVGLVMSGIVSCLGRSSDFEATTIIRPVFVSIAFAVILPLLCLFVVKPLTKLCYNFIGIKRTSQLNRLWTTESVALIFQVSILSAFIAVASFAGTSNLFAAYLAGASTTWWDGLCSELRQTDTQNDQNQRRSSTPATQRNAELRMSTSSGMHSPEVQQISEVPQETGSAAKANRKGSASLNNAAISTDRSSSNIAEQQGRWEHLTGAAIFEKYIHPLLQAILKPFFFASIGFSIPIRQMFTGSVVWRGIVYSILMILGKLLCGLCLVRFTGPPISLRPLRRISLFSLSSCLPWPINLKNSQEPQEIKQTAQGTGISSSHATRNIEHRSKPMTAARSVQPKRSTIRKPVSLYPAALLGSAMVARGEIGFLISSVAESEGVFGPASNGGNSELFLIVTWAILLCTILGPLTVGLTVRRVKRLQQLERSKQTGREDPLDIWGVAG